MPQPRREHTLKIRFNNAENLTLDEFSIKLKKTKASIIREALKNYFDLNSNSN